MGKKPAAESSFRDNSSPSDSFTLQEGGMRGLSPEFFEPPSLLVGILTVLYAVRFWLILGLVAGLLFFFGLKRIAPQFYQSISRIGLHSPPDFADSLVGDFLRAGGMSSPFPFMAYIDTLFPAAVAAEVHAAEGTIAPREIVRIGQESGSDEYIIKVVSESSGIAAKTAGLLADYYHKYSFHFRNAVAGRYINWNEHRQDSLSGLIRNLLQQSDDIQPDPEYTESEEVSRFEQQAKNSLIRKMRLEMKLDLVRDFAEASISGAIARSAFQALLREQLLQEAFLKGERHDQMYNKPGVKKLQAFFLRLDSIEVAHGGLKLTTARSEGSPGLDQLIQRESEQAEYYHQQIVNSLEESGARGRQISESLKADRELQVLLLQEKILKNLREQVKSSLQKGRGFLVEVGSPTTPERLREQVISLEISLAGGLILGFLLGLLTWHSGAAIRNTAEIEKRFRMPVLGTIPHTREGFDDLKKGTRGGYSFSQLVMNLRHFGLEASKGCWFLQVASPQNGDGRTYTAVHLARSLAAAGSKVLLVDGDFQKPQIRNIFRISDKHGLAEYLAGEKSAGESIQPTELPNLHVLPAGAGIIENLERGAAALYQEISEKYDILVLDTPPALAVVPDVKGRIAVLVVFRKGFTRKKFAGKMHDILLSSQSGFEIGGVINDIMIYKSRLAGFFKKPYKYCPEKPAKAKL